MNKLHPLFEAALAPFAPAPRHIDTLSEELIDNIDGAIESRGYDSRLTRWATQAQALEHQRDAAVHTLRDLHLGAQLLLDSGLWHGAALAYIKEVARVAKAALRESDV